MSVETVLNRMPSGVIRTLTYRREIYRNVARGNYDEILRFRAKINQYLRALQDADLVSKAERDALFGWVTCICL